MSELLIREEYAPLIGKNIVVGLTASSAIYKSIDLIRRLRRLGANIKVVMTRESLKFLGLDLIEWSSGSKPYIELTGKTEHIELAQWADLLVVAPATLNTLSKIAYGVVDELLPLLASTMLGLGRKVVVVPTMNIALYKSPQYSMISKALSDHGVFILPPYIEEDRVKYPPLDDLVHCIETYVLRGKDLEDYRALITAGPTYEYIDPVRIVTNPSSGLMGVLIARELACRGSSVDLVHGPIKFEPPYMVEKHRIVSTADMVHKIAELTNKQLYDIAVFAAAPADFTPFGKSSKKISSRERRELTLTLKPTLKTVKAVSRENKPRLSIIFVAETTETYMELVGKAREKIEDYRADLAIANNIRPGIGFSSEYIDACIVDKEDYECYGVIHKKILARRIADIVADKLGSKH
ncbi:MAG: phosphopantothenoylcysteine decarboxylase [Desulfurococcales archaeon ex4484_58]|nr:MAG: phosphopantothenoylcysteine decarboxylase [Desulfurococcales archaeon ex4484_58]